MARKSYRRKAAEAERSGAGAAEGRPAAVDPNVALFAARVREEQAREKAEKRAAREARRAVEEHQRLVDAKEAAAAELKRLRRQGGAGAERVARADAVYRAALAALITNETGEAPPWAPTVDEGSDHQTSDEPAGADPPADDTPVDPPGPTEPDGAESD
jgi:hypothetical protein